MKLKINRKERCEIFCIRPSEWCKFFYNTRLICLQQHKLQLWDNDFGYPLWCFANKSAFNESGHMDIVWCSVFWRSRICLQHHNVHICAWRHRGKATLPACIRHYNTGSSPRAVVWGATGYTSSLSLIHIDGPLSFCCAMASWGSSSTLNSISAKC